MFLNSLTLHNFRRFENLELHFDERLSVLVGNNGAGKSTILEAASIAAGTFTSAMDGLTNYGIKKTDAHYKYYKMGSVIDVQPQFPVSISAQGDIDGKSVEWERALTYANGRSTLVGAKELTSLAKEYQERMRNGDISLKLPIISYYGTGRLWVQHKEKKNDAFETSSRYNGYIDSLDGAANDKLMMKWFQRMTFKQYQKNEEIPELRVVCKAMEQSFASATGYEDVTMYYNADINDIDISYRDAQGEYAIIPMSQMSDGYRCTISLIADIAYRMALLNPQLLDKVLTQTEGIILIDEVDLHLHPLWQQRILKDLLSIFPKVQFIVSTHAPAVINSVNNNELIKLSENNAFNITNETYGKDVNTILREVMESSERPQEIKNMFARFYKCLDEEQFGKADEVLKTLEHILGNNDTEVNSCRVRLELEQM